MMATIKPRPEVMEARNRYLLEQRTGKVKDATKKRKRKPNRLRMAKQYWYELKAYFDPMASEPVPVVDGGWMLGVLEDFVVIEVPKNMPTTQISDMGKYLAQHNLKCLIVQEGVKFLRLEEVTKKKAAELDEILKKKTEAEGVQKDKLAELDKKIEEKYGDENSEKTETDESSTTGTADSDG